MRQTFKAGMEAALVSLGPAALSRRVFHRRALVLAYHNIMPEGERPGGDSSLHLPEAAFRGHLDAIEGYCDIVPLNALMAAGTAPAGTKPRVAITFDDAYRGAMTVGIGELRRRRIPATVFVTPGLLGAAGFWWDLLREPGAVGLGGAFRNLALLQSRGRQEEVLPLAIGRGLTVVEVPAHARAVTETELAEAATWDGMTLGAHSWRHPNLARLEGEELRDELLRPLAWLKERFPRVQPWLAYPYGLTTATVETATERAGYAAAFLVDGGWLPATGAPPFRLPRLNIPVGMSQRGFIARISGLLC